VASSANPSAPGSAVSFTATVSDTTGSATPTGSVEFFDGSTDLGPGSPLSGSGSSATSTFSTSTLAAGNHTITALYTHSGFFLDSSGRLIQNVLTPVRQGDTASIGFWDNKNGQGLINRAIAAAGQPSLANWLATSFPYLYGANSANNLAGKSNAAVAALFVQFFNVQGQKTDAEIMSAALGCWFTSSTLNGNTGAAHNFGFNISSDGTGSHTYNVGSLGTVIGLQNNTSYTVLLLLQQANLTKQNSALDASAFNEIFAAINQLGGIS
jgi:hypothetical protein